MSGRIDWYLFWINHLTTYEAMFKEGKMLKQVMWYNMGIKIDISIFV